MSNAHAAAPVAIHGWSASTYILLFMAALNTLGFGTALSVWIKSRGGWIKTDRDAEAVKRKQTDEVALDLVETLTKRIEGLETAQALRDVAAKAEAETRDAREAALRQEVRSVEGSLDALLLQVLKRVDPSIAPDLIELFADWRAERRREAADRRGDLRNDTQAQMSAARIVADAQGEAA